jgi:hypothetical protein
MYIKRVSGPRHVTLPDGTLLTRADLPPADTRRWVARRKAVVVQAVTHGLIPREEALERYGLTDEEFGLWEAAIRSHGEAALRVTKIQQYRQF